MASRKESEKKKAADGNIWQRFGNNAWVRYQRKRIAAKFSGMKRSQTIVFAVSVLVVLVAICGMAFTFLEYRKSDRIYENAETDYVTVFDETTLANGKTNSSGGNGANSSATGSSGENNPNTDSTSGSVDTQKEWYELISVDLGRMQTDYPDAAGWIYFENESISYPVMYSGDNEKYLRTAYTGVQATAGSIFLDGENTRNFSDPHTLIYGHNMKNLSMFGRLRYYRTEKDYYEGHKYFQIFTGDYVYRYEVFAYGQIPADSSIYYVYGADPDGEKLKALIRELKQISLQDTGVAVGPSDHIITLSTCTGNDSSRMIVSAVRVDEHRYTARE